MKTIIITSTPELWAQAQKTGEYIQSTINSTLDEVGFIHATNPDQTIAMLNRHFTDRDDILLLVVDIDKVKPEVKFEAPLSGSGGTYPHIYGAINTDAIVDTQVPTQDSSGKFIDDIKAPESSKSQSGRMNVPFYSAFPTPGHPEGVHCVETSLKMILGYFEPEKEYSIEVLEKITGKQPEKGSWSFQWSIWFVDHGYTVKHYTTFDFEAFITEGISYIRRAYGDETADWQAQNSDVELARSQTKEYLEKVEVVPKKPTINDIRKEHGVNSLVKPMVNSHVLNNKEGYEGHSVVVLGVDDRNIWFHDPGLPAQENRKLSHQLFQEAMDSFGGEMDVVKFGPDIARNTYA